MREHISLIQEFGGGYLGHCNPVSGKARTLKSAILQYFKEHNIILGKYWALMELI